MTACSRCVCILQILSCFRKVLGTVVALYLKYETKLNKYTVHIYCHDLGLHIRYRNI